MSGFVEVDVGVGRVFGLECVRGEDGEEGKSCHCNVSCKGWRREKFRAYDLLVCVC